MGARKKLVARILKSEPLILKFKPLISAPLKTRPAVPVTNGPSGTIPFVYMLEECGLIYHKATFPAIPKSRVAVEIPKALNTRLIVGMLILYPRSIRDI